MNAQHEVTEERLHFEEIKWSIADFRKKLCTGEYANTFSYEEKALMNKLFKFDTFYNILVQQGSIRSIQI